MQAFTYSKSRYHHLLQGLSHEGFGSKMVIDFSGVESGPKLTGPCLIIHYNNKRY